MLYHTCYIVVLMRCMHKCMYINACMDACLRWRVGGAVKWGALGIPTLDGARRPRKSRFAALGVQAEEQRAPGRRGAVRDAHALARGEEARGCRRRHG